MWWMTWQAFSCVLSLLPAAASAAVFTPHHHQQAHLHASSTAAAADAAADAAAARDDVDDDHVGEPGRVPGRAWKILLTGPRAKSWCLLIHAYISIFMPLSPGRYCSPRLRYAFQPSVH